MTLSSLDPTWDVFSEILKLLGAVTGGRMVDQLTGGAGLLQFLAADTALHTATSLSATIFSAAYIMSYTNSDLTLQ